MQSLMSADWIHQKPTYVSWMWELGIDRAEAEIRWCERTAKRIEAGEPYQPAARSGPEPAGWTDH